MEDRAKMGTDGSMKCVCLGDLWKGGIAIFYYKRKEGGEER